MTVPLQVTQWIEEHYKRPRIDPEWLRDCYAWLTTEGGHSLSTDLQGMLDAVEYQILESSFTESMLPGTGLPTYSAVPTTTITLEGLEIRVEVVSITEIASSAFSLNQTRLAREERTKAGNVDDGEGEGDIEIEGEGPMPKYSRGMLKFQLTDGTTMLPAIEYRPLVDLSLENTPLGYKMLLRNISIRRGVAFLEPRCVTLLGHKTAERDENRFADFARGLHFRMGLPEPEPAVAPGNTPVTAPAPALNNQTQIQPSVEVRSPLRDISPPLSPLIPNMNDDEDIGPRRRRVPTRNTDAQRTSAAEVDATSISPYFSNTRASKSGAQSTGTLPDNGLGTTEIDLVLSPKRREVRRPFIIASPPSPGPEDFWGNEDERPMNRGDAKKGAQLSNDKQDEQGKGKGKGKGKERATNYRPESSDDFEDDSVDFDPKFLEVLDTAEKEAYDRIMVPPSSSALPSTSGSSDKSRSSTATQLSTSRSVTQAIEVITIEDEDDNGDAEDKENVPVPTRHVRRRTDEDGRGRLSARVLSGSQRARDPGRPTILAKTASAVIDLSDSD